MYRKRCTARQLRLLPYDQSIVHSYADVAYQGRSPIIGRSGSLARHHNVARCDGFLHDPGSGRTCDISLVPDLVRSHIIAEAIELIISNNLTTLENMSHSYPTALLIDDHSPSRLRLPDAGGRTTNYSHTPISPHWRPDHLLDRTERLELQRSARELNVYDLGWRRNIMAVLAPHERGRYRLSSTLLMLWPLTAPPSTPLGEDFDYDDDKLEKLRRLTRRLRMADAAAEADEEMWEDD